ncbi:MAG: hypothetical protein AAF517_07455, partial [Planctomycetota bacterium]
PKAEANSNEYPAAYRDIAASGIFGKLPPKVETKETPKEPSLPNLIGIMDGRETTYAILRHEGSTLRLSLGEEKSGIKLLSSGTNRVLIEMGGKKHELSVFSGLGGQPLNSSKESKQK